MIRVYSAVFCFVLGACVFTPPTFTGELEDASAPFADVFSPDLGIDAGASPDSGVSPDACGGDACVLAPIAFDDTATVTSGQTILIEVLANDRGDAIRILSHGQPRLGLMNREGDRLRYRARASITGLDEVPYSISDREGRVASATVRIDVIGSNDPPIASPIEESTFRDRAIELRLVASDPNNDPITFQLRDPPQNGTLEPSPRGPDFLIYRPNRTFLGVDRFTYFAEDGALESNTATVSITVGTAPRDWADDNWARRRFIRFDNAMNNGNLDNFQVLIRLDPTRIDYSRAALDGRDLRFFDGNTVLAMEIESWVSGGESFVWLRVPRIDGNSAADGVHMYYGNLSPPAPPNPEGVWSGFDGVWHLDGGFLDSTSAGRSGTSTTARAAPGFIAGGAFFDGNALVDLPPSFFATDQGTLSFWARTASAASFRGLIFYGTADNNGARDGFGPEEEAHAGFEPDGRLSFYVHHDQTPLQLTSDAPLNDAAWHWIAIAFRQDQPSTLYVDGRPIVTQDHEALTFVATRAIRLGGPVAPVARFEGFLDEVRSFPIQRSAAWIDAEHRSMIDTFAIFGGEETGL